MRGREETGNESSTVTVKKNGCAGPDVLGKCHDKGAISPVALGVMSERGW